MWFLDSYNLEICHQTAYSLLHLPTKNQIYRALMKTQFKIALNKSLNIPRNENKGLTGGEEFLDHELMFASSLYRLAL